jgi:putative transposase
MKVGFKTELKVNNVQKTQLLKHAGVARHAWNQGLHYTKLILDINKLAKQTGVESARQKFPSAIDLHKWLVAEIKPNHLWYYESSKSAPQNALRALRDAWDRAFKKVSKPPRFKKKGRKDSFTLDGVIKVEPFRIKVPVIGWIKTYERLPECDPKNVTISRTADRWFISFRQDLEPTITPKPLGAVGVDMGINHHVILSSGFAINAPKPYKKLGGKLSKLQYLNRNKIKGSSNWKKAQLKIAKLHAKIANVRKDFIHKVTSYLAKNHSEIIIEDLNVSGMMANGKLAKAIADIGLHETKRQLKYKCDRYGSTLTIADRWFPSSKLCSNCGEKKQLSLSDRWYSCECGSELDRDLNASFNLLALSPSASRLVDRVKPSSLVEASIEQIVLGDYG